MIDIVSKSSDTLVARSSAVGKYVLAVILGVVGIAGIITAFVTSAVPFWVFSGVGAVLVLIGVGLVLFASQYTYTFDSSAGTLVVKVASLVGSSTQEYPLSDIARLVSWREVRRDRDQDGDTDRHIIMHYLLEFQSGDSLELARDRRQSFGVLSSLINTALDSGTPQPIQDIADFLGVEVVNESPNPSNIISDAVNGISN